MSAVAFGRHSISRRGTSAEIFELNFFTIFAVISLDQSRDARGIYEAMPWPITGRAAQTSCPAVEFRLSSRHPSSFAGWFAENLQCTGGFRRRFCRMNLNTQRKLLRYQFLRVRKCV
jgi:hypothetical protein